MEALQMTKREFLKLSYSFAVISMTSQLAACLRSGTKLSDEFAPNSNNQSNKIISISDQAFSELNTLLDLELINQGFTCFSQELGDGHQFLGDDDTIPHQFLWNKEKVISEVTHWENIPEQELIIVGGGMSGLIAASQIPDGKSFLLLESSKKWGGNSQGAFLPEGQGLGSLGAAYITIPDSGSEIDLFLKKFNLDERGRIEEASPVVYKNTIFSNFSETLEPLELEYMDKVKARLNDIFENEYPEIPNEFDPQTPSYQQIIEWDKISFEDWLKKEFGELPTKIFNYFQVYCWSSFNASINEVSAAQGLNFLAAEVPGILVYPGGNAFIAQKLIEALVDKGQGEKLISGALVLDIEKKENEKFQVSWTMNQKFYRTMTTQILFAAPKMLLRKVLSRDLYHQFPQYEKALNSIEYRPYIVAQVRLSKKLKLPSYDHFMLQDRKLNSPSPLMPSSLGFTDIINTKWAQPTSVNNSDSQETEFLTIYKPFPYQGAQQFLFSPLALEKNKKQISKELTQSLAIKEDEITEIHLARWGHAIPIAKKNLISEGTLKVFQTSEIPNLEFAGQDCWCNPAFETAFTSTINALKRLRI